MSLRASPLLCFAAAAALFVALPAAAEPGRPAFKIETIAETVLEKLPKGPLYWRIETFPSIAAARAAAGPTALAAEASGRSWLFTLAPAGGATPGGTRLAEIGPLPAVAASRYRLRINRAGGPPGAKTPVHSHPGSESFYVLKGELSQRTPHGIQRVAAGEAMNGHGPNTVMQLTSSGRAELDQLVMFVVDADKPFSPPTKAPW
jgi:quercetin dioxygenase-like cupin family protein